jgi:TRAP-type C4-dicarboxylate transport system substrate-binding protein
MNICKLQSSLTAVGISSVMLAQHSGIWSSVGLRSNNDLKALQIRASNSVSQAVLQPLTTVAMNVSFADVMPMLKDGRANGVLSSGDGDQYCAL